MTASAAGLAPVVPPAEWFEDPKLEEPTPLQVTEDGRIFGHAALWDVCHIGLADACVLAPRSRSEYSYFLLGEVEVMLEPIADTLAEQVDGRARIPCGTVTLGTGHAPLRMTRERAVEHYDNTGTGAADVCAGEDEHGIWIAGALRPDLSEERVRELRASKISGDWRDVGGHLELVAMLAVNVPGFPVPRVRVASVGAGPLVEPMVEALVAAGVADRRMLDATRDSDEATDLAASAQVEALVEQALDRRGEVLADSPFRAETLTVLLEALATSQDERRRLEGAMAEALVHMAQREAPTIETHVHVPQHDLSVHVDAPEVVVPERETHVHVEAPPAPSVTVEAPRPADVHVDVHAAPQRPIRVEEDPDTGSRRYVPE